jgi:hypothetical protein
MVKNPSRYYYQKYCTSNINVQRHYASKSLASKTPFTIGTHKITSFNIPSMHTTNNPLVDRMCASWNHILYTKFASPLPVQELTACRDLVRVSRREIVSRDSFGTIFIVHVRHVTGNDKDYLRKIPRVVVQKSALSKGPL